MDLREGSRVGRALLRPAAGCLPFNPEEAGLMLKKLKKVSSDIGPGRMLVATHINPDGDALGSLVALCRVLEWSGADVRAYLPTGMPPSLSWLDLPWPVARSLDELGDWAPRLLVTLDCGDSNRAGPQLHEYFANGKLPSPGWEKTLSLNIDHHISNSGYADINWIEADMSSTGEMVGILSEHLGHDLSGKLGEAIYLALVSDTGNFSYANTTASSLALAARIVGKGLDLAAFTSKHENNWSLNRMHLWGRLMSDIALHHDGRVASCVVTLDILREHEASVDDLDGLASMLRRIKGVQAALFIRENPDGSSKASLRSMRDIDVGAAAAVFGGGGHKAAAGAELSMPPEEARDALLEVISRQLG